MTPSHSTTLRNNNILNSTEDVELASLMNYLSLVTASGSFLFSLYDFFMTGEYIHGYISLFTTSLYLFIIVFNKLGYYKLAKLHFLLACPIWPAVGTVLIGGNFSQAMVACVTLVNVFIFFNQSRVQLAIVIYNVLLFVIPRVYVNIYEPIFGIQEVKYEEILVFFLSLTWIFLFIKTYENRVQVALESLHHKNLDLEQKTVELERFNHIASHDLKSPLRSITSFLSLIERDLEKKKYDKLEGYFSFVKNSAKQMHRLIEGVLEVSSISNRPKNPDSYIDLNAIVATVLINLQSDITERQALIEAEELPDYYANESDMVILFQNLVQNGIKYNNSDQPTIKITSEKTKDSLILRFTDNGIGIAPEFQDKVFDFFARLHTEDQYQGTGLGLGIVKKLVEKYKGSIKIDSVVNEYTTFQLILPMIEMK